MRPAGPSRLERPRAAATPDRAARGRAFDVAVVGAGFGGLGAALSLAERGARVVVLERLGYPGGCASSFERGGLRFDAGATLCAGLGPRGLFGRWIERLGLDVRVDWLDPVIELRAPGLRLPLEADRRALERRLAALPGAPVAGLRAFFAHQRRAADVLWGLLDEPDLLPPLDWRALRTHAARAHRYAPLVRDVGKPLARVLARHGLASFAPLRLLTDALCQITVQCGADEAEAPLALAALDYCSRARGTGHVRGGIGQLAGGLVEGLRGLGGEVRFGDGVRSIARDGSGWRLAARRGPVRAGRVVANLLPRALDELLDPGLPRPRRLCQLAREVERGWGACMLYLAVRADGGPARHLQLVADPARSLEEGNHVFCSLGGEEQAGGLVTATVSTHVPMDRLRALAGDRRGAYVDRVQSRMRATLAELAPELDARVVRALPASPRTFERFTGRPEGLVGGVPRRAGLRPYLHVANPELLDGLTLVGDSVFPGQSTLAAALGGWKAAQHWSGASPAPSGRAARHGPERS